MDEQLIRQEYDFVEKIPIEELFSEIRKITGLSDLKFSYKISEDRRLGKPRITFESEDIVNKVGFLKLMFSTLIISQFSSEITEDRDTGKIFWWGSVDFSYNHPSGGSNGYTFLRFTYTEDRGFEFKRD